MPPEPGRLLTVISEETGEHGEVTVTLREKTGLIHADLTIGANVADAQALQSNQDVSNRGIQLFGAGFIVTPDEACTLHTQQQRQQALTLLPQHGVSQSHSGVPSLIRDYRNGRDLTDTPRGVKVIDAFGLSAEQLRNQYPVIYQWLLERVKPERDQNNRATYRDNWWIFGEPRKVLRKQLADLPRYIATVETAKHRIFQFLDASILPDNKLIAIALSDAFHLGVLSSRLHGNWALAMGSWLGVGNDPVYVKSRCFETFPFPDEDTGLTPELRQTIADLAEQIDLHRKRVLGLALSKPPSDVANRAVPASLPTPPHTLGRVLPGADFWAFDSMRPPAIPAPAHHASPHPREPASGPHQVQPAAPTKPAKASKNLTLTGLYNVLDKLRQNQSLTPAEKVLHEHGLISLLRTLHDELDAAVLQAYGWHDLSPIPWGNEPAQQAWTDTLLTRLTALNAQRATEEQQGQIRWLRPAFQDPVQRQQQTEMLLNKELPAHINQGLEADFAYKTAKIPAHTGHDGTSTTRSDKNGSSGKAGSSAPPQPWPATLPEQVKAVAQLLASTPGPLTLVQIEAAFKGRGGWKKTLPTLLETLVALGRAQHRDQAGMIAWGQA